MKTLALIAGSIVLGLLLMVPLGMLFDAMDWPLFHTWGLAHGSFVIAWPMLACISFFLLRTFLKRIQSR
jgi:hypothetical protein